MIHVEDKSLALPDGRTLAYADNGNTSSSSIILFFHGAFSVGDASRLPRVLVERNVHFVAPSLPGWGKSSPVHAPSSYATSLAADITALITHLRPRTSTLQLYICGHSFGTVPAQILYGLSHDTFPLGRQTAALLLLAPFSPPHCHREYARSMSWTSYFLTGPPAPYIPFNFFMYLVKISMASHMSSEASAQAFFRKFMKNTTSGEEREMFSRWLEEHGIEEVQFEREVGRNMMRSVAHTWRGFMDIPTIYHSGWGGACPEKVIKECPTFIVSSKDDYLSPEAMAKWLAENYRSATFKSISGSHLSSFFYLNDLWNEIFARVENSPGSL